MAPDSGIPRIITLLPALGWVILLFYFSLLPGDRIPGLFHSVNDLLIHCGIYFVLTTLLILGWLKFNFIKPITRKMLAVVLAGSIIYGGVLEIIQYSLIFQRTGDWLDVLANTIGSLLGVLMLIFIQRITA